jgi:nucleolar complex protein 3
MLCCAGTPLAAAIPSIRALARPTALDAEAARQDMAKAAQQLLQDPMRHLAQLEKLLGLARATDSQVRCLAMLTLLAVFKDLLPAYRIHSKTREELPHKVTKGVEQLQHYEAVLLQAYHSYLKLLFHVTERAVFDTGLVPESRLAVKCMAGLLQAAPHFNYRSGALPALTCLMSSLPPIPHHTL